MKKIVTTISDKLDVQYEGVENFMEALGILLIAQGQIFDLLRDGKIKYFNYLHCNVVWVFPCYAILMDGGEKG